MDLPQTLHAQLYLVGLRPANATDSDSNATTGGTHGWLFGFALRAAMLTDLYLTGHVEDKQGKCAPDECSAPR